MKVVWTKTSVITLVVLGLILVLLAVFGFRSVSETKQRNSDAGIALLQEEATDTKRYETLLGNKVTFNDMLGQIIYINSWASWSPLSRDELIALNDIAGQEQNADIHFVALNRKESKEQAARFLATLPPLPNLTIIVDTEDHFYQVTGGYAMPETVIYNANGELFLHERTPQTADMIKAHIEALRAN